MDDLPHLRSKDAAMTAALVGMLIGFGVGWCLGALVDWMGWL